MKYVPVKICIINRSLYLEKKKENGRSKSVNVVAALYIAHKVIGELLEYMTLIPFYSSAGKVKRVPLLSSILE